MQHSPLHGMLFLLIFGTSLNSSYAQPASGCIALEGVWEYDLEEARGLLFIRNGHYLRVRVPRDRTRFAANEPSIPEKAAAYDGLDIGYGTLTCDNKMLNAIQVYAKDPALEGVNFEFEFEINGSKVKYWGIMPDGTRGPQGESHKVADFSNPPKKGCEQITGFWEYNLPDREGIAVAAGNYFAWILVSKDYWETNKSPETIDDKALAFDNIMAVAGTFSCDDQGIFTWNRLHAKDYRTEGISFSSENKFKKDYHTYWVLDEDGNRTDMHGTCDRLK